MSWRDPDAEDTTIYKVVVNHEEQYSIWPADRENPLGWKDVEKSGPKAECLAYIKEVWTDMRPLSLRKKMEEAAQKKAVSAVAQEEQSPTSSEPEGDDLVSRLSEGDHPIEVSLRPEVNIKAFKESIDRGYVHIKFTDTKGGTELGVRLDGNATDLTNGDFESRKGRVFLAGDLTLNYVKVRCIADIDLNTLAGQGHLEPV